VAAVEIQRAVAAREAERFEPERIRFRLGIKLGDVVVDGSDIYGDGINVAARIEGLCEPGGIWLSRSVHTAVAGKLDVAFEPTGRHRVKNITEPIETWRVRPDAGASPWQHEAQNGCCLRRPVLWLARRPPERVSS
jgi:adenylate cyclase